MKKINEKIYLGSYEINPASLGKFTGLTEDDEYADYTNYARHEPREIFEGDILELMYDGKLINCEVVWEICGFLLGSNDFEDSYIWLTELIESDGDDHYWAKGARIIGNKIDKQK